MAQAQKANWQVGAVIGLSVGLGLAVSKWVEKLLAPSLGSWGAFGVAILVVLVGSAILGIILTKLSSK